MPIWFQTTGFWDPFWIRLGPKMTHKTAQERPKPCTKRSRERPKSAQGNFWSRRAFGGPIWDPLGTNSGPICVNSELLGEGEPSGTHFGPIWDLLGTNFGPIWDPMGTHWGATALFGEPFGTHVGLIGVGGTGRQAFTIYYFECGLQLTVSIMQIQVLIYERSNLYMTTQGPQQM